MSDSYHLFKEAVRINYGRQGDKVRGRIFTGMNFNDFLLLRNGLPFLLIHLQQMFFAFQVMMIKKSLS